LRRDFARSTVEDHACVSAPLPLPPIGGKFRDRPDQLRNRQTLLGMTIMTAIALAMALWTTRAINPIRGDTYEYLFFDPSRTVGYPAFLWIVRLITGNVALAVQAQMFLLAASLLFLGWSFHAFVRRPAFSYVFQAFLVIQVAIWKASAFLMTEAVSTALVAIWCAVMLRLIRRFSLGGAALLILVSGLATMVRPSLVALFLGAALFLAVVRPARERARLLLMTGLGAILAWSATPLAQILVHGSVTTTSPIARGVLQHTLYCDQPIVARDPDSAFVEQNAAKVRRYIGTAPPDVQEQLQRAYSTPLRFGLIIPVLGRRHNLQSRSQVDPYLSRIASERVEANPACYAGSVVGAYYRMATFDTNRTKQDEWRISRFTATHPPVEVPQYPVLHGDDRLARQTADAVHNQVSGLNPQRMHLDFDGKVSGLTVLPVRLFYGAAAIIGLLALVRVATGRQAPPKHRRSIAGVAALGLSFHAILAITAIVELGLSRYVIPLWPMVCTTMAIAALGLVERRRLAGRNRAAWVESALEPALT